MQANESQLVFIISSIVTVIVSGFAVWKSYYEARKTQQIDNKVGHVQTGVEKVQQELDRTRAELREANERLKIAQADREKIYNELMQERRRIIILEGQNANQENRLRELSISITTLTALIKERESDVARYKNSPAVVRFVVDTSGIIREVSPNVFDILGFKQEELVGRHHIMVVPRSERAHHEPAFLARAATDEIKENVTTIRQATANHKDGGLVPMRIELSEHERDGKKIFVVNMIKMSAGGGIL